MNEECMRQVATFIVSENFMDLAFRFMDEHDDIFQIERECKSGFEHKLEFTDVHRQFVDTFENLLERYIFDIGSTVEDVYTYASNRCEIDEAGDSVVSMVQSIITLFEYDVFASVMVDKEKRRYLRQITDSWRNTLNTY